jgi:hypothetical protein
MRKTRVVLQIILEIETAIFCPRRFPATGMNKPLMEYIVEVSR